MAENGKVYVAQEKQKLFHLSTADETLYGGAAGGGKSYSIIWDAVLFCMSVKNARVTIFRRKFNELEKSIIMEFLEKVPAHWYQYNKKDHKAEFYSTKAVLEFNHCQYDQDTRTYQSAQYDRMYFDELTHFSEYSYTYLMSRCRTTKTTIKAQVKSATNPGNIGHQWVKKRFVDAGEPNTVVEHEDEKTGSKYTTMFIPAKLYDNDHLVKADPGYISRLLKLPDSERKALLDGDWYSFEGQYFPEWDYDIHVVTPFAIPPHWGRIRCLDWGYTNPTAVLWIAFDPNSKPTKAYVYRELSLTNTNVEQVTMEIMRLSEGEKISYTVADPSLWSVTQYEKGTSLASKFMDYGVPMMRADNARVAGWSQVHSYLYHDETTLPMLAVFNNCFDLIRTLPALIHDQKNPEDLNTEGEDHWCDALRYGLMTKPVIGRKKEQDAPYRSFDYWLNKSKEEKALKSYAGRF